MSKIMGDCISNLVQRLFDYPLKNERKCAYKNDQPAQDDENTGANQMKSNYDKIVKEFNQKLLEKRTENREKINGRTWEERNIIAHFPEWNESTISYLHSLYLTFCSDKNMMIDFEAFSCILECLGNECPEERRKHRFKMTDQNNDGFIEYKEYLQVIYNFGSSIESRDASLRYACLKIAEKTRFINGLSIGEQLEHGLF
ncbi:unnamed protein product [Phaedon cochleariae]|uniref:EF-hand domain-containing protein n=1 Tax=Phaedon cochleariae TaxID=80249 RepID=A0A9P0DZ09_PHACE|nr:unnamed protein product [Phaedon cochleariae]